MKWNKYLVVVLLFVASCGQQENKSELGLINLESDDGTSNFLGQSADREYYSYYRCDKNMPVALSTCKEITEIGRRYPVKQARIDILSKFEKKFIVASTRFEEQKNYIENNTATLLSLKNSISDLQKKREEYSNEIKKVEQEKLDVLNSISNEKSYELLYNNQISELDLKLLESPQDQNLIESRKLIVKRRELTLQNIANSKKYLPLLINQLSSLKLEDEILKSKFTSENQIYEAERNYILSVDEKLKTLLYIKNRMKIRLAEVPIVFDKMHNDIIPFDSKSLTIEQFFVMIEILRTFNIEEDKFIDAYIQSNFSSFKFNELEFRNINGYLEGYASDGSGTKKWYPLANTSIDYAHKICEKMNKEFLKTTKLMIGKIAYKYTMDDNGIRVWSDLDKDSAIDIYCN